MKRLRTARFDSNYTTFWKRSNHGGSEGEPCDCEFALNSVSSCPCWETPGCRAALWGLLLCLQAAGEGGLLFRLLLAIPSWLKDKGAHQQLARGEGTSELLKCSWSVFKDTHEFKGMPGFATKKYKLKIENRHVTRNFSLPERWAKAITG